MKEQPSTNRLALELSLKAKYGIIKSPRDPEALIQLKASIKPLDIVENTEISREKNVESNIEPIIWEELELAQGIRRYRRLSSITTGSAVISDDRPTGIAVVVVKSSQGEDEDWQEYSLTENNQTTTYYLNLQTHAISYERPEGYLMIIESSTIDQN